MSETKVVTAIGSATSRGAVLGAMFLTATAAQPCVSRVIGVPAWLLALHTGYSPQSGLAKLWA
jgi:hypothetical protein